MRPQAGLALAALSLLALPAASHAQGWQVFRFDDQGFAVQLPAAPQQGEGRIELGAGPATPAKAYTLKQDDVVYSMTVADLAKGADQQAAIADAVKAFSAKGQIKQDVNERIDRQFGRQLSVDGADGSRSAISIFVVNGKLYELEGKALSPSASGKTIRFQQSLEFINLGAERFRPENQPGGGGPGQGGFGRGFGGRRGGPPPAEAIAACQGKAAGDKVQFTGQGGQTVAASCIQTQDGLAARPDGAQFAGRGPGGGPPPAEAIAACQGKAAGDAVSFTGPGGRTIAAACIQTPNGLAARPNRRPFGGPGQPPA